MQNKLLCPGAAGYRKIRIEQASESGQDGGKMLVHSHTRR